MFVGIIFSKQVALKWRHGFASVVSAGLLLASCAAPSSYMGISLSAGAAAPNLQDLARRALAGDKRAQSELGTAYEQGLGVPVDLRRARKLYRIAAADIGGTMWIYTAPTGNGTKGRVYPVDTGPRQAGLPEARMQLERLYDSNMKPSILSTDISSTHDPEPESDSMASTSTEIASFDTHRRAVDVAAFASELIAFHHTKITLDYKRILFLMNERIPGKININLSKGASFNLEYINMQCIDIPSAISSAIADCRNTSKTISWLISIHSADLEICRKFDYQAVTIVLGDAASMANNAAKDGEGSYFPHVGILPTFAIRKSFLYRVGDMRRENFCNASVQIFLL